MKDKGNLYIVYGGQYGSEGKGEVAAYLANNHLKPGALAVRIGGPNAGHTSYDPKGNKVVVQSLPTPSATHGFDAAIGAEGVIILDLLAEELQAYYDRNGRRLHRLFLDRSVAIITAEHMAREQELKKSIGSTGEGVGACTADKVMRVPGLTVGERELLVDVTLTNLVDELVLGNLAVEANLHLLMGGDVLIEGTQGWGLGLHTSGNYPYCTSRECTPQALLAGTGINPKNAATTTSVMVVRTYPIRVGGNSGPLKNEVTWEWMQEHCGVLVPEITTVTKKVRRVASIDFELLAQAVIQTGPDCLAVTFLDYPFPDYGGSALPPAWMQLPAKIREYLLQYDRICPVRFVTNGPGCTAELKDWLFSTILRRHPDAEESVA